MPSSDEVSVTDAFAMLQLAPTATPGEIRKSYRVLSLKYHPDKVSKDVSPEQASHRFDLLHKAYELLSDPATRERLAKQAAEEAQRRERVGKFEAERKKMSDELEQREKEQEERRRGERAALKKRQHDLHFLKEESRRLREERSKSQAAAAKRAAEAAPTVATHTKSDSGEALAEGPDVPTAHSGSKEISWPELGPLDSTVRLLYPSSLHQVLSPNLEQFLSRACGQLVHFKETLPPADPVSVSDNRAKKRKRTSEVVCLATFVDMEAALRLVEQGGDFHLADLAAPASGALQDLDQIWVEWARAKEARKARKEKKAAGLVTSDDDDAGREQDGDPSRRAKVGEPSRARWWRAHDPDRFRLVVSGQWNQGQQRTQSPRTSSLAASSQRAVAASPVQFAGFEADVLKRAMAAAENKKRAAAAAAQATDGPAYA
ncbi:unnamed protein product [Parajaminaea phylloscopi]